MCFNERVSILAYLAGMSGSGVLWKMKRKPEALFFGWVSQMQLIEYFLWQNQPCQLEEKEKKVCEDTSIALCNDTNKAISKIGLFVNHLEPLVLFAGIQMYSSLRLPLFVIIILCIFIVLNVVRTVDVIDRSENNEEEGCTLVTEESYPHLYWKWNEGSFAGIFYISFLLILVMLSYYGVPDGYVLATMSLITFITSHYVYGKKHSTGAMWCLMAAFSPWILAGIYSVI